MPLHCCVPRCTRKGYRTDEGEKISYFQFPKLGDLKQKWIHTIRRDEGSEFTISKHTRVCSRHFKLEDLKKSFNGIVTLKPGAVPSKFSWSVPSPAKRKPPKERHSLPAEVVNSSPSLFTLDLEPPNVVHDNNENTAQRDTAMAERIVSLESELAKALSEIRTMTEVNEQLRKQVKTLEFQVKAAESHVFKIENFTSDKDITLYTGFPNLETLKAVFDFLNPGTNCENIRFCSQSSNERTVSDDYYDEQSEDSEDELETKRPVGKRHSLKPLDEFFLVLCRLRRGFSEAHLGHLFGISQSTVSKIFIPWINFMYLKFGNISIWPSKNMVNETMPESFKAKY